VRKIVIGDVQGCLDELKALLDLMNFNSASDRVIFLGDLVNRGPKSLEVLEFLYSMDHCVLNTLGNHDLHLLALTIGNRPYREKDRSIKPILDSKNKINLIEWLRHQPLMHEEPALDAIMVHAGIHPEWDILQARSMAKEIESLLQSDNASSVLTGINLKISSTPLFSILPPFMKLAVAPDAPVISTGVIKSSVVLS